MVSKRKSRQKWRRVKRNSPRSFCVVYGLCDESGKVRYIGQTRQVLADRIHWYFKNINFKRSKKQKLSPVEQWIDELSFYGISPSVIIIDDNATWDISEIIYIERYKALGHELLNVTRGGNDGIRNIRREQRISKPIIC